MSSPDSFTFKLDITPVPVIDAVMEACINFPTPEPTRLSPDSAQTVRVDLDPGTQVEGGQDDEGSDRVRLGTTSPGPNEAGQKEVTPAGSDIILWGGSGAPPSDSNSNAGSHACSNCSREGGAYCHCRDRCGNHFNDLCGFRDLYLRCTTHTHKCWACHEPIDQCECDPLSVPLLRQSNVVVGIGGLHQVLVNDILTAINAATAHAQGEEAIALQRAEERVEGASEARPAVEVHVGWRGNHRGQVAH